MSNFEFKIKQDGEHVEIDVARHVGGAVYIYQCDGVTAHQGALIVASPDQLPHMITALQSIVRQNNFTEGLRWFHVNFGKSDISQFAYRQFLRGFPEAPVGARVHLNPPTPARTVRNQLF